MKSKVFVIGANKTGTTTLKDALNTLGYNFCPESIWYGNDKMINFFSERNLEPFFHLVKKYDAFEDRPWNYQNFYKILNNNFPGSKFILTIREPNTWIDSVRRFSEKIGVKNFPWYQKNSRIFYGVDDFLSLPNNTLIELYNQRNIEIIYYFKDKNNFLIMDLEKGDGWHKLCNFLNCPIVDKPFPHSNKSV
jgi:hypothetical protein